MNPKSGLCRCKIDNMLSFPIEPRAAPQGRNQTADGIELAVAPADRQDIDTIMALELDRPAFDSLQRSP
ncbi:MAG TPA: hypothetical protein P5525_02395 [Candidatus Paceibacterota bacterium]|nr:hypothetical protein [Candidatus Paceibacterota bacterium]